MAFLGDEISISKRDPSHCMENGHFGVRSMDESDFSTINDTHDDFRGNFEESRWVDLMSALQRLARLRTVATSSSVHARQKKREASIRRQNVWTSDEKFMSEVQRLVAHSKLKEFEGLQRLAEVCQISRDVLGPVEQEAIETEQEWEGHTWVLRQAEEDFAFEYQFEFEVAGSYPPLPISVSSSAVSDVDDKEADGAETVPTLSSFLLPSGSGESDDLDLDSSFNQPEYFYNGFATGSEQQNYPSGSQIPDSDSGFGDIDDIICSPDFGDVFAIPSNAWRHSDSNEFYSRLLTGFESTRDRINKWLENTVLQSHLEGTALFNILARKMELEMTKVPSNWAQLVMAYWEIDGATTPYKRNAETQAKQSSNMSGRPRVSLEDTVQSIASSVRLEGRTESQEDYSVEFKPASLTPKLSISENGLRFHRINTPSFAISSQAQTKPAATESYFSKERHNNATSRDMVFDRLPLSSTNRLPNRGSASGYQRAGSDVGSSTFPLKPP